MTSARPQQGTALTNVWVNEAAADRYGWRSGQAIDLVVDNRELHAYVAGIWRDYEHQGGAVVIDRDTYVVLSGDRALNTVWMWLDGTKSVEVTPPPPFGSPAQNIVVLLWPCHYGLALLD